MKVLSYCSRYHNFIPFYGWMSLYLYTTCFLSIHLDRHWGCFHLWGIMNNATMNVGVQVSILSPCFQFFFGINLGMEFLCHTAILYLIFWGITKLFSTVAAPFYINSNVWSSNLSTFSSTFVIFLFYPLIIAILVCTKWYLIGVLIFISLMTNIEHLSCIHWPIGQMPIQVHYPLLNYIAYFCCYWAVGIHCIFLI